MSDHPLARAITNIVDEAPEDIDEVIVIVKGKCHKCQKRDGITVISSIPDFDRFADLLLDAARYAYVRGFVPYGLTPDDDDGATLG